VKQQFRVRWPPTANHCYVTTKGGRRVLKKDAKQYMEDVAVMVARQALDEDSFPLTGLLIVEATYYPPDNRRRDTDNVRKVLADGLAAGLMVDDSRFLWRDQDRTVDRIQPGVSLVVYPKEEKQ
jgi:Holliday junction resolvase RusA-like endonuclease